MAIAPVKATASAGVLLATSVTISGVGATSGNTLVLTVFLSSGSVTSVTSSPSQTWTFQNSVAGICELWTSPLSSAAVTSITANFGTADACAIVEEYSGVAAFGNKTTTSGGTPLTITLTMQDANNWMVGGYGDDSNAITTTTGTQRATVAPFNARNGALSDNTQAGTGSLSITWSAAGTITAAAAAIELRSTTGAGTYEDDSFNVQLVPLPTILSPSIWLYEQSEMFPQPAPTLAFDDDAVGPIFIIISGNSVVSY